MTATTPIGASVPAVDQGAPSSTGSGCGGDVFLALVQGLLDAEPVPAPAPTSTTASDAAEPAPGDAAPGEDDTPPADPALLDPTVPSLFAPTIVASLVASVAPGLLAEGGDQAGALVEAGTVLGATEDGSPTGVPAGPPAATTTGAPAPRPERAEPAPSALAQAPTAQAPTAESPGQAPEQPASGAPSTGTQPAANPTAAAGPASSLTVGAAVAPTAPPAAGAAPAAPLSPVARQVFPEVVKLTTSTDGPQRVTIRLNPESLGEVRVVLTERRGALEVSLSGGSEARRALLDGTPELQRLLDAVGRGDSRIVVRDAAGLPVTAPSAGAAAGSSSGQPGTTWSGDLSGGAWTGAGRSGGDAAADQGRHPTPGSSNATDGIPAATTRSRTTETVTGARPGLDVTM